MKRLFSSDHYILVLLLFSIPFGRNIFSPILYLWLFFVLVSYFIRKDYSLMKPSNPLFIPIVFYLIFAISSLLTTELKVGLNELQFKLTLLLIPLLYPSKRESYKQVFDINMISFIIGCVVVSLYLFGYATYQSFSLIDGTWVFNPVPHYGWDNYYLGAILSNLIHPSFYSQFLLISLLIIGLFIKKWWMKGWLIKFSILFSIIVLITTLIMIQSRAGILGLGLMSFAWLAYLIVVKRKFLLGMFMLIAIIASSIILVNKFIRFSETLKSIEKTATSGTSFDNSKEDGTSIRLWVWKSAVAVIEQHPVLGVGAYNVKDYLNQEYVKRDMKSAASEKLNAHNQFLETWLGLGVIGLITLLLMLIVPLRIGLNRKDWFLVGFILLCCLGFMFESMLERIVGIVFFVIFYSIFVSRTVNYEN